MPTYGFGAIPANYPVIPRPGFAGLGQDDSTGLFGTGFFGAMSTWGTGEWVMLLMGVPIGLFALYSMFHQTKQAKYRMEGAARKRRVRKATKLRARAKRLEEKEGGLFF
jgi:hypothetical protein